jgi:hypothetical protein
MMELSPEHQMGPWVLALGSAAIGFILGCLTAVAYFRPHVMAISAKMKALLFMGAGVGLLVWGVSTLSLGETFTPPWTEINLIRSPIEAMAWGAGLLTAGVLFLVFSFLGFGHRRD